MQEFNIPMTRTGYGFATIVVKANSQQEAEELAMERAGDAEYTTKSADYELTDGRTTQPGDFRQIVVEAFEIGNGSTRHSPDFAIFHFAQSHVQTIQELAKKCAHAGASLMHFDSRPTALPVPGLEGGAPDDEFEEGHFCVTPESFWYETFHAHSEQKISTRSFDIKDLVEQMANKPSGETLFFGLYPESVKAAWERASEQRAADAATDSTSPSN
jgi:hypothetical protein